MGNSVADNSVLGNFGMDNSVPDKALVDNYYARDWIHDSFGIDAWRADYQYSDFPVVAGQWMPVENRRISDYIVVAQKAPDLQLNQPLANMILTNIY